MGQNKIVVRLFKAVEYTKNSKSVSLPHGAVLSGESRHGLVFGALCEWPGSSLLTRGYEVRLQSAASCDKLTRLGLFSAQLPEKTM